jgi:hypothetical protein
LADSSRECKIGLQPELVGHRLRKWFLRLIPLGFTLIAREFDTCAARSVPVAFEIEPQWLTSGNMSREHGFSLDADGEDQKVEQVFSSLLAQPLLEKGLRWLAFLDVGHGH